MRVTRKVFSEKLISAIEERAFNEGYKAAKEDEEKKKKLGTAAKVGLGIAGTTAAVGGGLVAARKGLLGHKVQDKVGRAYEKLGEKLGMKSLVEKGKKAQWESAATEAEREWFDKTKKAADAIETPHKEEAMNEFYESMRNLDEIKGQAAKNIQERHQGAAESIKESVERIKANNKKIKENDNKQDEIDKKIEAAWKKFQENTNNNNSKLDEIDDILGSLSL